MGRVQSAWPNPLEGGICPDVESFPPHERELFKMWSYNLLGASKVEDTEAIYGIACVLLLHYRATLEYLPAHRLNLRMQQCMQQIGQRKEKLEEWCDDVKARFDLENGLFLPLDQFGENAALPVRDIHEFMVRSEEQHAYLGRELRRLSGDVSNMRARYVRFIKI